MDLCTFPDCREPIVSEVPARPSWSCEWNWRIRECLGNHKTVVPRRPLITQSVFDTHPEEPDEYRTSVLS